MAVTIEDFLISLGFQVNRAALQNFQSAVTGAGAGFALLARAAELAAGAIEYAVGKISDDLDRLYFQSQRTKASAENLVAFGYAARQTGSSAEAAASAVESLADKMRRNPGFEAYFKSMGINSSDPTQMIQQLQKRLSNLPLANQLQYADLIGVDAKTWMSLSQEGPFKAEQADVAKRLGLNIDQAAKSANQLWTQIRSVGMILDSLAMKVVQELAGPIGRQLARLKELLLDNSGGIVKGIELLTKAFVFMIEVAVRLTASLVRLGSYLEWVWTTIPAKAQGLIEVLLAVAAAAKILSLAFMRGPIGLFILALTALLLLIDDFTTYQKYGKEHSFFDWGKLTELGQGWVKAIRDALIDAAKDVKAAWQWLIDLFEAPGKLASTAISTVNRVRSAMGLEPIDTGSPGDTPGGTGGQGSMKIPSSEAQANAARFAAVLQKAGKSREQIAGAMGNIDQESGFNPRAVNSLGMAGLMQLDTARRAQFKSKYGMDVQDASVEQQAEFFLWELDNTHKNAGKDYNAATTVAGARSVIQHEYEIPVLPSDPNFDEKDATESNNRQRRADFWFRSQASTGTPGPYAPPGAQAVDKAGRTSSWFERATGLSMPPSAVGTPHDDPVVQQPLSGFDAVGPQASITQTNHYTINGGGDPHEVTRQIAMLHDQNNQQLLRNTRGALT